MSIEPRRPVDRESPYSVYSLNEGAPGSICARVKAFDAHFTPPKLVDMVYARIYEPEDPIPGNHPGTAIPGAREDNDIWYFADIPGAAHSDIDSGGVINRLAVWAKFDGEDYDELLTVLFTGVTEDQKECDLDAAQAEQGQS